MKLKQLEFIMLKHDLSINKFRCYEVKIVKGWELNPGNLWLELPVLCHL